MLNIYEYVDYNNYDFLKTIVLSFFNIIFLGLVPYLQYKYKIISKFTGDDMGRAADILAFILIHIGSFRNYSFIISTYESKRLQLGVFDYPIILFGFSLALIGGVLVLYAFRKLGLRGMYFGDHFGFLMKKRIDSFPYNYMENPQYVGSMMIYIGFSFICRSLTGFLLTGVLIICNQILFRIFEKKRLKEFYKDNKQI